MTFVMAMIFLVLIPKAEETTAKKKKKRERLYRTRKLLHGKEKYQQNEKATYRMEKNIENHISDKHLISKIGRSIKMAEK